MTRYWLRIAVLGCLVACAPAVYAQDAGDLSDGPNMYAVELEPTSDFANGNAKYLQGEADPTGQRFKVEGLGLDQPILVSVLTKDPSDKVRVRIVKDDWAAPDRDEVTTGATRLDFAFRTFDGFKVWVTADKPTEYQLIVWAGDPLDAPIPAVAVAASTFVEKSGTAGGAPSSRSGMSFTFLELGLAGALALGVLGLVVFVLVRRKVPSGVSP